MKAKSLQLNQKVFKSLSIFSKNNNVSTFFGAYNVFKVVVCVSFVFFGMIQFAYSQVDEIHFTQAASSHHSDGDLMAALENNINICNIENCIVDTRKTSNEFNVTFLQKNESVVVICTGNYAARYHKSDSCRGLNNCKGDVVSVRISEAKEEGRTQCGICYK